jgi:hypothetical protein
MRLDGLFTAQNLFLFTLSLRIGLDLAQELQKHGRVEELIHFRYLLALTRSRSASQLGFR